MKVGSLVVYDTNEIYLDMITPQKNNPYTVRDVGLCASKQRPDPHKSIRLEEIVNGNDQIGRELYYRAEHFKEIQPPMDLTELLEATEPVCIEVKQEEPQLV